MKKNKNYEIQNQQNTSILKDENKSRCATEAL